MDKFRFESIFDADENDLSEVNKNKFEDYDEVAMNKASVKHSQHRLVLLRDVLLSRDLQQEYVGIQRSQGRLRESRSECGSGCREVRGACPASSRWVVWGNRGIPAEQWADWLRRAVISES